MKKKYASMFCGAFLWGLFFCVCNNSFGQNQNFLKGIVVEENTNEPLKNVSVNLKGTKLFLYSNEKGFFQFDAIPTGEYELEIVANDYISKVLTVVVSEFTKLDFGIVFLKKKEENFILSNVISLNENDFSEENNGGSDNITGFLQSSKSVFLRTAAFSFGQARFKIRGYDSRERMVSINGISMNKLLDGRPQWSNWGGLNDVLRNQNTTTGIAPTKFGISHLGGVTNFMTRASRYRKGNSVSFAGTNGSYKGRVMLSHFSGIQKNNWSYALSFSSRFGKSGFMEGTPYKAWSGFVALEKRMNEKHSLNFTALFTPNERGKSAPITKEVFEIKGNNYNSYWGFQNGKMRNSRIKKIEEPIFMISHYWNAREKLKIESTLMYQFGFISNSRLGYQNAESPDPVYYKKMPSYYLRFENSSDFGTAYLALQELQDNGQINWQNLYATNATTNKANYFLFEDRNNSTSISFNSVFEMDVSENLNFSGGINFSKSSTINYAKLLDVFGENGFKDVDPYLDGEVSQNDLKNPDKIVSIGDPFSYNYELNSQRINMFGKANFSFYKWDGFVSMAFENVGYQRNGLFQNGAFKNNSFGKGSLKKFVGYNYKTGFTYKLSGRKLVSFNTGYFVQPPFHRNVFTNVRYNHNLVPDIKSVHKFSSEITYEYRAPSLKIEVSGYYTNFKNDTEISFTYADGLRNDEADFVSQIVSGIEKRHLGMELGIEWKASETIKLYGVAAIANYKYTNNPKLYIESDLYQNEESYFGNSYLKNYRISGTPQNAYSLGFEYRDPKYWWYQINGNLLTDNYLQIAPLIRTENFFTDTDGVPFMDNETGEEVSKTSIQNAWKQEKFSPLFLVNLVGGKSWKIKESYLGLFLSVNNVLNTIYKTGGFEQSRNANYENFKRDKNLEKPLFDPKYWYSQGTSYYLILSFRY